MFPLGRIVATPGALRALERADQSTALFLARHAGGWGELDREDVRENEYSVAHGFRLSSSYTTATGESFGLSPKPTGRRHSAVAGRVLEKQRQPAAIPTQIDRLPEFLEFEDRISNQQRRNGVCQKQVR
jgi:hypothetical protein